MTGVCNRKALTDEDVPQVAPTVVALNLYPLAIGIGQPFDGACNLFVKGRPAAVSVELVVRTIELCVAAPADIRAWFVEVVVRT